MSDRKYRQHGYQDSDRSQSQRPGPAPRKAPEPFDPRIPRDPRTPNMPGFRDVFRCARCGALESLQVGTASVCGKCGTSLHSCANCASFDSGARFECMQTIPARIAVKDAANTCGLFSPRVKVERETGSTPAAGSSGARKAFDDLFKF